MQTALYQVTYSLMTIRELMMSDAHSKPCGDTAGHAQAFNGEKSVTSTVNDEVSTLVQIHCDSGRAACGTNDPASGRSRGCGSSVEIGS